MTLILRLIFMIPCSLVLSWDSGNSCSPAPDDELPQVHVRFFLCTRISTKCNEIDDSLKFYEMRKYGFNPRFPTFVLIHGFMNSRKATWVQEMMKLLTHGANANIFKVDWSSVYMIQEIPDIHIPTFDILNYKKAVISTPSIAAQTAHLINSIASTSGVPLKRWYKLHFIGHSLGAHIAGQAARKLKNSQAVRVTGLDPAGPCFEGIHTKLKLNRSDAQFVDIIHTNCEAGQRNTLGIAEAIGTIDFYPNGGNHQPRCTSHVSDILGSILQWTGLSWLITEKAGFLQKALYGDDADFGDLISNFVHRTKSMLCDHEAATKYFIESMRYPTEKLYGVRFEEHGARSELSSCVQMGIHADMYDDAEGIYFVNTSEDVHGCDSH